MTAAARALKSNPGPSTEPMGTPTMGARRTDAAAASPAASTQTSVPTRRMGMPSCAARSDDSAAARMAMPYRLVRRNVVRPVMAISTTMTATRWLPRKM